MASFEHPRKVGTVTEFAAVYEGWRRLQQLSGEAVDLPPGPQAETLQNSTFEACERAERVLLGLAPRSDSEAAALIEVLLGNEEVATLGGPTLRRIQAYLSPQTAVTTRHRRSTPRSDGRPVQHRAEARFR